MMSCRRAVYLSCLLLGLVITVVIGASGVGANAPSPADQGNEIYQQHCSTCHGDRGQGLAEWRLTFDPAHQNCDRYNCHDRHFPPGGFYLPNNFAPRIVGENTLTRFQTAQDLYDFVSKNMPFQEPGSLAAGDYWLIITFLVQLHNVPVDEVTPQNARQILLHAAPESPIMQVVPVVVGVGVAWLLAAGFVVWSRRRQRNFKGH